MTITDSVRKVLKHRSFPILKEIFTVDVKVALTDLLQEGRLLFQLSRKANFHPKELKVSLIDGYGLLKILPGRIQKGLKFFGEDFLRELEYKNDQAAKTEFCFKVFGALISYTLEIVVSIKSGKPELALKGFRTTAFTRFLAMGLILRIMRHFLRRLLSEIGANLELLEDREKIKYFHDLLSADTPTDDLSRDPAIDIVEKLRFYILNGIREV